MEVDSRFTKYSACNFCNGTDPFSRKPCQKGTYSCDCENFSGGKCATGRVGRQNVSRMFANHRTHACEQVVEETCGPYQHSFLHCRWCLQRHASAIKQASCSKSDLLGFCPSPLPFRWCTPASKSYECWRQNIPKKTGGLWYSTLKNSLCNSTSAPGSCGWRVLSSSSVREECLRESLITRVERASPECFRGCGKQRNQTSPCWIGCFFDTVLGPHARNSSIVQGLPMPELISSWKKPFLPESQGGCPKLPHRRSSALDSTQDLAVVV